MSAAAFAYMQQQAAARTGLSWCQASVKGKAPGRVDVYTQGKAGERLLKQRPHATTKGQSAMCSWLICASLLVDGFVPRGPSPSAATVGS